MHRNRKHKCYCAKQSSQVTLHLLQLLGQVAQGWTRPDSDISHTTTTAPHCGCTCNLRLGFCQAAPCAISVSCLSAQLGTSTRSAVVALKCKGNTLTAPLASSSASSSLSPKTSSQKVSPVQHTAIGGGVSAETQCETVTMLYGHDHAAVTKPGWLPHAMQMSSALAFTQQTTCGMRCLGARKMCAACRAHTPLYCDEVWGALGSIAPRLQLAASSSYIQGLASTKLEVGFPTTAPCLAQAASTSHWATHTAWA
jgi:hypothetical protein